MKDALHGECEDGDVGIECAAILAKHLITAMHTADGCVQNTEAAIGMLAVRLNQWLFADHTITMNLLHFAVGIGNDPMAS